MSALHSSTAAKRNTRFFLRAAWHLFLTATISTSGSLATSSRRFASSSAWSQNTTAARTTCNRLPRDAHTVVTNAPTHTHTLTHTHTHRRRTPPLDLLVAQNRQSITRQQAQHARAPADAAA
eukprot:3185124-Rhodomonas_salina.3